MGCRCRVDGGVGNGTKGGLGAGALMDQPSCMLRGLPFGSPARGGRRCRVDSSNLSFSRSDIGHDDTVYYRSTQTG